MTLCFFQMPLSFFCKARGITLSITTSLTPRQLRTILGRVTRYFSFPKSLEIYRNSSNFLLRGYLWFSLRGQSGWGVKLANFLYLEPILTFWRLTTYIYICRTAQLTSRCYILNIYSTNIHTEYFKHAA